jgi:hypothetical protein
LWERGEKMQICPLCNREGYFSRERRGNRYYVYFKHKSGGKCYLGADTYYYVEKYNRLGLTGIHDKERFKRYLLELIDQLTEDQLKEVFEIIKKRLNE